MNNKPSTDNFTKTTQPFYQTTSGAIACLLLFAFATGALLTCISPEPATKISPPPAKAQQAAVHVQQPTVPLSKFEVVNVKVSDSAAKTQIEVMAAMKDDPRNVTAEQVRQYLQAIYADKASFDAAMWADRQDKKAMLQNLERDWGVSLKQFNFAREVNLSSNRTASTHFYVMVYFNKDEAKELSNWVGRLAWRDGAGAPEVEVKDARIADAHNPGFTRFGLSKDERMQLFKDEIVNERLTDAEQVRLYPDDGIKQAEYWDKTRTKRRKALAKKYHLTQTQLDDVLHEALQANWPKE